jgi:hypothetical protein
MFMALKTLCKRERLLWRFIATIFITSRLWVAFFVYWGQSQRPFLALNPGGWVGVPSWWLNAWTTFDSQYFLHIAINGYTPKTSAFFPLYPLLLKIAGNNILVAATWGIIVSNTNFFIALYYFYKLTRLDFNGRMARLSVLIIAFFPTTAFFSAVYSESLFSLLAVGTFYYVRRNCWSMAALCAILAALTRNSGPIISIMLGVEYWQAKRKRENIPRFAWVAAILPCMTFIMFQRYLAFHFGGNIPAIDSQKYFSRHLSWPWTPIFLDLNNIFTQSGFHPDTLLGIFVSVLAFILVIRHWKRFPKSYSLFVLMINLANLCYSFANGAFTVSATRFQMTTFPFTQMLAKDVQSACNRRWGRLLILGCYLIVCAVMCWFFGKKSFIG